MYFLKININSLHFMVKRISSNPFKRGMIRIFMIIRSMVKNRRELVKFQIVSLILIRANKR